MTEIPRFTSLRSRVAPLTMAVWALRLRAQASSLEPAAIADSAPLGSQMARSRTVSITGDVMAGTSWQAFIAGGSEWLDLSGARDTVPGNMVVSIRPAGLSPGSYRDTIVVTMESGGDAVQVPVQFVVTPAGPAPITATSYGSASLAGPSWPKRTRPRS